MEQRTLKDYLYKEVSLILALISLGATFVGITFYFAGTQSELKLLNQKLDNHITHISAQVSENNGIIKDNQEDIVQIQIDIATILEKLK